MKLYVINGNDIDFHQMRLDWEQRSEDKRMKYGGGIIQHFYILLGQNE